MVGLLIVWKGILFILLELIFGILLLLKVVELLKVGLRIKYFFMELKFKILLLMMEESC